MIKNEMLSHSKKRLIQKMLDGLKKTGEGQVTIRRRRAFTFINSG
jgi:hypothetical protein